MPPTIASGLASGRPAGGSESSSTSTTRAEDAALIRDVVVHLFNEQPVLADLFEMPAPRDIGLILTNLRTLDGRRPTFADRSDSTFFFPYQHIRFVEIPQARRAGTELPASDQAPATPPPVAGVEDDEIDADFLRRIREV